MERHYTRLPERLGAGKSKTRAACHGGGAKKAVAAMTCPGVPTHRKRLRPAERVETESATYAECLSRSGSGGHGQRRGRVAAQCRLSAPNADGKQKRHCAIKLNANGRLDNLLSAICRSSPLEAGGGTRCMAPQVKSRRAFLVRCAKAARRRKLLLADPGSIKMNGSD